MVIRETKMLSELVRGDRVLMVKKPHGRDGWLQVRSVGVSLGQPVIHFTDGSTTFADPTIPIEVMGR